MKKILILESNEKNFEAIGKAFENFKIEIVIATSLEEAKKLTGMFQKIIISQDEKSTPEETCFATEQSKEKPVIVIKHEGTLIKFGKFRPEISFYWMSGIFKKNDPYTWGIVYKELEKIT